jgi:DNA primase
MFRNKKLVSLISEMFGLSRKFAQGDVEVEFNCPKCDRGKNKYNLAVNTDHLFFHCWACKYKGKITKLFWDYGSDRQKMEFKTIDTYTPAQEKEKDAPLVLTGFRTMRQEWKDSLTYRAARNYLKSRNIGKDLIDKWDICYAEEGKYRDRVIIPSRTLDGKMDYFVARDIFDTQKLKYKNPPSRKAEIIFGEKFVDWKKPVVLTEGAFDALVLYNAVPLLGSKIEGHKRLLTKIFQNRTPIILGFDDDAAGKEANIIVGKYLMNLGVSIYTIVGNEYGDLAKAYEKAGKEYIVRLIRNAQPFDELDMLINDLLW